MQGVNRLLGRSPSKLDIDQYKETKKVAFVTETNL